MFWNKVIVEEEQFEENPKQLVNKILEICGGKIICEDDEWEKEKDSIFAYQKHFDGVEVASVKGDAFDYLLVSKRLLSKFKIFGLTKYCSQNKAARVLMRRGFDYCNMKDRVIEFDKEDLQLFLIFKKNGRTLIGIEVCRKGVESRLLEKTKMEVLSSLQRFLYIMNDD